jgi:hypothetical protein
LRVGEGDPCKAHRGVDSLRLAFNMVEVCISRG